jgi:DnaK suppressor protein
MDELTAEQLSELQGLLSELEQSIRAVLESTEVGTKPVKLKDNIGRLSRMDEMHNQSILKANRNVLANRLKTVSRARILMDKGSYGFCEDCDEPIAFARLQAYPDASLCIECQSDRE